MQANQSLSDQLLELCKSDLLSVENLRKIIDQWKLTPNNNLNIVNHDFFIEACKNASVDEEIIKCLLDYFPAAASATNDDGWTPLHFACQNKHVGGNIIKLLIDAAPDSVSSITEGRGIFGGHMPLHNLCVAKDMDETKAIEILVLLLKEHPGAVRHVNKGGYLPIHTASSRRSLEFCQKLVSLYPGSERISTPTGFLPLHCACNANSLPVIKYLYELYPEAAHHSAHGHYPIHLVIDTYMGGRTSEALDAVKFLLDRDAKLVLKKHRGESLLHFSCVWFKHNAGSAIATEICMEIIRTIYGAHPNAIDDVRSDPEFSNFDPRVQSFINEEVVYSSQAKDHLQMTKPNERGQLPLHRATESNVTYGSIRLLVGGNPSAIRCGDINSALPLHLACQHHHSPKVVKYFLDLGPTTLRHMDYDSNTALHYACRGAKYETIAMLLEEFEATAVSRRNVHQKLPMDLLFESDEVVDRESVEYTDCVFRLLKSHPNVVEEMKQLVPIRSKGGWM